MVHKDVDEFELILNFSIRVINLVSRSHPMRAAVARGNIARLRDSPSYKGFNDRSLISKLFDDFNDRIATACNKAVRVTFDAANDSINDAKCPCSPNPSTIRDKGRSVLLKENL